MLRPDHFVVLLYIHLCIRFHNGDATFCKCFSRSLRFLVRGSPPVPPTSSHVVRVCGAESVSSIKYLGFCACRLYQNPRDVRRGLSDRSNTALPFERPLPVVFFLEKRKFIQQPNIIFILQHDYVTWPFLYRSTIGDCN